MKTCIKSSTLIPCLKHLSLNISDKDNSLDLELALEVTTYFRLADNAAKQIINQVKALGKIGDYWQQNLGFQLLIRKEWRPHFYKIVRQIS